MFINLIHGQLTVDTYRKPQATVCDIMEIQEAYLQETGEALCCAYDEDNDAQSLDLLLYVNAMIKGQ